MDFYKEESNFFYMYFQIIKEYKIYLESNLESFDIRPAEIGVLSFLINNRGRNVTASDISIRRGISKGLVSKAVSSLLDKGLIRSEDNPQDGRSVYLLINNEDSELITRVENINQEFKDRLLKDIDEEELNLFLDINRRMLDNIKNI